MRNHLPAALIAVAVTLAGVAVIIAVALGVLSGGSSAALRPQASSASIAPRPNGLIYFQEGGGDGPTWTDAIQADGSGRDRIFGPNSYYDEIAWSPDGRRIAYVGIALPAQQSSDGQVHFGIYTASADGSNPRLLTEGLNEGWPSWSPDGTRIAFSSSRADAGVKNCIAGADALCPTNIYLVHADGTGVTRLTDDPAPEFAPAWSPDGASIAFVRSADGTEAIDAVNADGTDERQVATGTGGNQRPFTWSPDGRQIAFVRMQKASWDLDVVNADGTGQRTVLSRNGVWTEGPAWSPDGTEIAFSSTLGAYPPGCGLDSDVCSDLFVIHPDGSGIRRLTQVAVGVFGIAWQPSG